MDSTSAGNRASSVAAPRAGATPAGNPASAKVKSARLFPDLFAHVDPGERLKVLEVGCAQPETVDFFSRYKCRLQFLDLYASPSLLEDQGSKTEAELSPGFRKALGLPKGEKYDVCLFWDVMQYMTGPAIRALCGALEPHLHKRTRAHALGVHSVLTASELAEYAIVDDKTFRLKPCRLSSLEYHPHPQAQLGELLTVFKIERAMLMGDGTVEMLMASKPYWDSD